VWETDRQTELLMQIAITWCTVKACSMCCYTGNGILKNPRIAAAMKAIDRGLFCRNNPYMDAPQGIGYAVTISAPHMVTACIKHCNSLCVEIYLTNSFVIVNALCCGCFGSCVCCPGRWVLGVDDCLTKGKLGITNFVVKPNCWKLSQIVVMYVK